MDTVEESVFTLRFKEYNVQNLNDAAEVNAVDFEGNAALSLALMNKCDIEAIGSLLEKGADVNKVNHAGRSPLCIALQHPDCNFDLVHLILQAGASENVCLMHKNLLQCYSANAKHIIPDVLKLLLIKQIGTQGFYREALCHALNSATCRVDVVKALLEMGCHVNKCILHDSSFSCYFDEPVSYRRMSKDLDEEVVKLLLGSVTELRMVYGSLRSPLCLALGHPNCTVAIVKLFLEAGATFKKCLAHKSDFHCFIDFTASVYYFRPTRSLNIDILRLFLGRGVDLREVDSRGASALCMALNKYDCSADVLRLLLDAGASMNCCIVHGSTLMCYAVTCKVNADVVKLMLERGVDVHEVSYKDDTPLHAALRYSKYEISAIEMLMDHPGFDVNKTGGNKSSFLHCALQNSHYKRNVVQLLLNRGAKANAVDSKGYTTLQIAVRNPYCDTDNMKRLLDNGCPVYRASSEVTPLEVVLRSTRRVDVVRLLLTYGAPINVKRDANDPSLLEFCLTLYDIVAKQDCLDCLEMFVKYTLLVTPHLDINNLIEERIHSDFRRNALLRYVSRCVNEVKRLDVQYVAPGKTLRQLAAGLKNEIMHDFDVLVKILANNEFPVYFDIISTRVKRVLMEDKLHESHAYVMSDLPCKDKRKIVLDRDCTCDIGSFLSDNDLLSYLAVYYASKAY